MQHHPSSLLGEGVFRCPNGRDILLLPRPALMHCSRLGDSAQQIATAYGVSEQLVKHRTGVTRISRQAEDSHGAPESRLAENALS
jgi:hypothetical protein